jgi:hypothetical protein
MGGARPMQRPPVAMPDIPPQRPIIEPKSAAPAVAPNQAAMMSALQSAQGAAPASQAAMMSALQNAQGAAPASQAAMMTALQNQAALPQAAPPQLPPGLAAQLAAARPALGFKKGGKIPGEKKMIGKEIAFMKQKGAPKSMIKHEKAEAKAMGVKAYAKGGRIDGCASKGKTKGRFV